MRVRDLIAEYYNTRVFNMKDHSRKDFRKRSIHWHIDHEKYIRDMIRKNQKEFGDIRKIIPKNTCYCYTHDGPIEYHDDGPPSWKVKNCPFWYSIEIPGASQDDKEAEDAVWKAHPGLIAVGQTAIGGCKLLNETDDDCDGFGLFWDQCKSCGINER